LKYRKKPIVIDAEPYHEGLEDGIEKYGSKEFPINRPYINTLEGKHYINPTDWIITGVRGERYPIKEDIFLETYEKVD
jgi:hypothetical protein